MCSKQEELLRPGCQSWPLSRRTRPGRALGNGRPGHTWAVLSTAEMVLTPDQPCVRSSPGVWVNLCSSGLSRIKKRVIKGGPT